MLKQGSGVHHSYVVISERFHSSKPPWLCRCESGAHQLQQGTLKGSRAACIRVNSVAPGFTETEAAKGLIERLRRTREPTLLRRFRV